ncbi:conserved exported hypothetical protein [Candidatus Accumulibacter aalborgensis]|uniref:Cbb3-type cytochrome oxidase component n=1 Tax=Candidatus Accumulibacter aalborgensis TaxID=1860102 RepID=A0A1A8XXR7_9PROT|nr:hypothetical protein [Candidatus Accumulibacter aalborgensis]SBT08843.1 conserved exported hypothetical protein [Candidatus Accumulibacter aalborgensis]
MDSGSLADMSWRAFALVALIAGGLVWAFVFFLRRNNKDLESLEETLADDRKEGDS